MVIPVYNAEKHLRECIESVIDESLTGYEIIAVDDGSPDSSGDICDEFARRYDFVKAVHKENGGAASARNAGLDAASGEYISFIDSDDRVDDGFVKFIFEITERPADIYALAIVIDHTEAGTQRLCPFEDAADLDICEAVRRLERAGALNYPCSKVYSRALIDASPETRFMVNTEPGEDLIFNADCYTKAKTVTFCSQAFYHWMRRGEDTLANRFRADLNERNKMFIDRRCRLYRALGMDETDFDLLSKGNLAYVFSCVPNMYRKGKRFPRKQRIAFFREVIRSDDVKRWFASAEVQGALMKQFARLIKLRSAFIADAYYSVAMGLRNGLNKAWTKTRKRVGA